MKFGIIAGNGRFPIVALESARKRGDEAIAIAIREEAAAEVEREAARCYWVSLGELSKLIEICKAEGVTQIMMAGQVKHAKIFSSIKPDWRLLKVLGGLLHKNTDSLIGAVVKVLADEGIQLVDSTLLLKPLLAPSGAITKRKVNSEEQRDIDYGRKIAHALASLDLGQSVAIADRACVALEAMEGTDAMLRRAASLVEGKRLTLVKASSRRRHLLFDVPVIGPGTIDTMIETNTTALAVDAGRTLMLDREELLDKANAAKIAILGAEAVKETGAVKEAEAVKE
jgi:UDP-2,3-diacylglucosamine hydrolase